MAVPALTQPWENKGMGRRRVCAMYQRKDFTKRSLQYERSFRREVARFVAAEKDKPGRYRRETRWWQGHRKAIPKHHQRHQ